MKLNASPTLISSVSATFGALRGLGRSAGLGKCVAPLRLGKVAEAYIVSFTEFKRYIEHPRGVTGEQFEFRFADTLLNAPLARLRVNHSLVNGEQFEFRALSPNMNRFALKVGRAPAPARDRQQRKDSDSRRLRARSIRGNSEGPRDPETALLQSAPCPVVNTGRSRFS